MFKRYVCVLVVLFAASGCANLVRSVTQGFAEDLAAAILDNPDIEMVRDGAPSYLILIDSLVSGSPNDKFLLQQSATLHSAYAAAFVNDETRAKLLHAKAKSQALRAACVALDDACRLAEQPFREFSAWVQNQDVKNVPLLYTVASSWAGWVQANSSDFAALADLAKLKEMMTRVAEIAPDHENGSAFLYLGVFETLLPRAMGGNPELGRQHFEEAIARSNGEHLLSKVMFAEQYARLVFDRELHDQLLREVVETEGAAPGLALMNAVAKRQAQQLMETADDYF